MKKWMLTAVTAAFFMTGCAGVVLTEGGDVRSGGQALSAEQCKEQCKSEFHECRESRPRGSGNSQCAHQKNSCERRC